MTPRFLSLCVYNNGTTAQVIEKVNRQKIWKRSGPTWSYLIIFGTPTVQVKSTKNIDDMHKRSIIGWRHRQSYTVKQMINHEGYNEINKTKKKRTEAKWTFISRRVWHAKRIRKWYRFLCSIIRSSSRSVGTFVAANVIQGKAKKEKRARKDGHEWMMRVVSAGRETRRRESWMSNRISVEIPMPASLFSHHDDAYTHHRYIMPSMLT